jgi:hypothetical protein
MAILESIIIGLVCVGPVKHESTSFAVHVDDTGLGSSWVLNGSPVDLHAASDHGECGVLTEIKPVLIVTRNRKPLVVWTEANIKIPD